MKRSYYLFNPGRLSRKDNTLKFTPADSADEKEAERPEKEFAEKDIIREDDSSEILQNTNTDPDTDPTSDSETPPFDEQPEKKEPAQDKKPKFIPVEGVEDLYVFGSLDVNSATLNFLGKNGISAHFFDYYDNYTGSFTAKDYLLAGKMQIEQTRFYLENTKRLLLAQRIIEGASFNILKNLKYYQNREKDVEAEIFAIEGLREKIYRCQNIAELMGIEGNIRQVYYQAIDQIVFPWKMQGRQKNPPGNEVNALISFGNSLCYAKILTQIYHTQLNPTISFLHEPGARRYSLALDISEIFKPVLVDRLVFRMLNKKEISADDFDSKIGGYYLKDSSRKKFIKAFDDKLQETIDHKALKRKVSYLRLVRLECYKLSRHILDVDEYRPFKMRW